MQSDYVNCGKLRSLHPILKKWIRLNRRYCENEAWKDCAWWANERASISTLAGAAWTYGGIALEEYSTPKISKKKQRTGRCDLYIKIGRHKFACEAKQVFPRLKKSNVGDITKVKQRFEAAWRDARDLAPQEGRRLGICFVTPRFPLSQILFEDSLRKYLVNLNKLKFDAIAWCFPKQAGKMKWLANIYPGVVLLIREVK